MEKLFEVYVPVSGPREEIMTVKWAYENLSPTNWCFWPEGKGVIVRFQEETAAEEFRNQMNGFMGSKFVDGLMYYTIDGFDLDHVRAWSEENLKGNWRLITGRAYSRIVIEEDADALLFRLSFD